MSKISETELHRIIRGYKQAGIVGTCLGCLLTVAATVGYSEKLEDLKDSNFARNKELLKNSKPIEQISIEIKINGNDTVSYTHKDTVSWIVPDKLIRN